MLGLHASRDRKAVDKAPGTRLPENMRLPFTYGIQQKTRLHIYECECLHVDQGIMG